MALKRPVKSLPRREGAFRAAGGSFTPHRSGRRGARVPRGASARRERVRSRSHARAERLDLRRLAGESRARAMGRARPRQDLPARRGSALGRRRDARAVSAARCGRHLVAAALRGARLPVRAHAHPRRSSARRGGESGGEELAGSGTDRRFPIDPPYGSGAVAWRTADEIERWLDLPAKPLTRSERARYRRLLAGIRERGYAVWRLDEARRAADGTRAGDARRAARRTALRRAARAPRAPVRELRPPRVPVVGARARSQRAGQLHDRSGVRARRPAALRGRRPAPARGDARRRDRPGRRAPARDRGAALGRDRRRRALAARRRSVKLCFSDGGPCDSRSPSRCATPTS